MIKNNMNANEIARQLAERVEAVAKYLFPYGKRQGKEFCIGSTDGEEGKSLKVCLEGDKKGVFSDFATGEGGDLLDLWATTRKIKLAEAINEARQWLGIGSPQFVSYRASDKCRFNKPAKEKLPSSAENQSGVKTYLIQERKLIPETLQLFDIRATVSEIIFPYWKDDQLWQIKYLGLHRPQGKKQIRVEKDCEPCLFGWQALPANTRQVALTEGEIDCMTLHQYGIPSLSVPFGAGNGSKLAWLETEFERLGIFDIIYLCFDQDTAGQATLPNLIARLGRHRCRIVRLPHKDANECLKQGITQEQMEKIFAAATSLDPVELKSAATFAEEVIAGFYPPDGREVGWLPPWPKSIGKILFRPAELSVFCGINGHGKSQFIGQIVLSSLQQGARVCIASLEMKPARLLMRLTRQAAALEKPSPEYITAIHQWYRDKLWIFDLVGTAKVDQLLSVFEYARQRYGIDVFVIDSMLKCGIAEEDLSAQKAFIERLCDFKHLHNCHIYLVVHPRKGMDETKAPGKLDMKGSGAISDLADNCFTVWRNKGKQDKLQKQVLQGQTPDPDLLESPDCLFICDKQRNGDWEGKMALWFDMKSYQFLNHRTQKPIQYVTYSRFNPPLE
jgi:twinkle protein